MPVALTQLRGFAIALIPAALGGAAWEWAGLPLGWLIGAALATGGMAVFGVGVGIPKPIYNTALALLGASVGLSLTPDVGLEILAWAPVMVLGAAVGITCAALIAPLFSRFGGTSITTAFFSLLPGGVIEMSSVGANHGADRETIAALHTVRLGLVVVLLPLALFAFYPTGAITVGAAELLAGLPLFAAIAAGLAGGYLGRCVGLPAGWLLGAVILVGALASTGTVVGGMPSVMQAAAQVLAGIGLGARFRRESLTAVPRAMVAGLPSLLAILALMALFAVSASQIMPQDIPTLVLCFSIGGMAEMVLTAKSIGANAALVAGFQAVRGVIVNVLAGALWARLSRLPLYSDNKQG